MGSLSATLSQGAPAQRARPTRALVLIGFMGAGKSTAARDMAAALGTSAVDADTVVEERLGHSVAQEFSDHGEHAFRVLEEQVTCELLERAGPGTVLALGGGSVTSERVQRALAAHLTVLLDVDADQAWERVATDASKRPLAGDRRAFAALLESRAPLYARVADAIVPARRGVPARALDALARLADAPPGTRMLWACAASGDYPVFMGRGLLGSSLWPLDREASRPFGVTDETVRDLYAERLGLGERVVAVAPGERHKTLASAELIWSMLVKHGVTRADHVVALGGGVVGDLAGFCAATYQRGVPVVHVPTTVVSQVDSAYGGKTGVDLPEAKNYVGAYHQPAGVLVDPDTLESLPDAERAAGLAEVIKTALIAGGELWRRVSAGQPIDEEVILACARTKLAVVAEDERDGGRRQVLNLGHTVGHAIETASGYARYRHGEAVGLGLLAALRLSAQEELRATVAAALAANGLPVRLEHVDAEAVLAATACDKKRLGRRVPFVLVHAPGDVRVGAQVSDGELRAAIAELTA